MHNSSAKFKLDEIQLGQKEKFEIKITESLVNDFARISGDFNPLHMNQEYAIKTPFKKRICHGMLLAAFFSKLVGMHIPGENSTYLSQTLRFILPCFINDEIIVEGEVVSKSIATRMVTVKTSIHNKQGECLVQGEAKVLVRG